MVKIIIIAIGKDKDRFIAEGSEHYVKLLSKYAAVDLRILSSPKVSPSLSPPEIMAREADLIEKGIDSGYLVALSERGQSVDSIEFARLLEKRLAHATGPMTFLIGGAYGLDERLIKRADLVLSLSKMTFSHQLVRLVLIEQLYRAFSILGGSSYHK